MEPKAAKQSNQKEMICDGKKSRNQTYKVIKRLPSTIENML